MDRYYQTNGLHHRRYSDNFAENSPHPGSTYLQHGGTRNWTILCLQFQTASQQRQMHCQCHVGICIPYNSPSDESVEHNNIRSMQNYANSTCVANSKLVSSSLKSTNRRASGIASHNEHAQADKSRNPLYKSTLGFCHGSRSNKGFFGRGCKMHRRASSKIYKCSVKDSKWSIFSAWCQSRTTNGKYLARPLNSAWQRTPSPPPIKIVKLFFCLLARVFIFLIDRATQEVPIQNI